MKTTEQIKKVWKDDFGIEYTKRIGKRHEKTVELRKPFWKELLDRVPEIETVAEFGCNAGINLEALTMTKPSLKIVGIEPMQNAREQAIEISKGRYDILEGDLFNVPEEVSVDLGFTCNVLIHVAPKDLDAALNSIYSTTKRYILAIEYYWPKIKAISYRGEENALWKMDYGALWLRHFDLHLMDTGFRGAEDGFDNVTWWLFKK